MNKQTTETKKRHFNIIDVIIIVAILAVIAVVIWLVLLRGGVTDGGDKSVEVEYTVRFTLVREEYVGSLKVGDAVINSQNGNGIGEIVDIKTNKSTYYSAEAAKVGDDGKTVVTSEYPDLYDVYVKIKATGTKGVNDVVYVDGIKILIGSPVYLRDNPFAAMGFIVDF